MVFEGTNWLDLKNTKIEKLCQTRDYLKAIKGIDLSHGSLGYFCPRFLYHLYQHKTVETIKIDNNYIDKLPQAITDYRFRELYIGHNPYKCTCAMTWMHDWLVNISAATNETMKYVKDYEQAICESGIERVRGKPIYQADGGKMGCGFWLKVVLPVVVSVMAVAVCLLVIHKYIDAIRFLLFLKFDILTGKDDDMEFLDELDFDLFVSHR